jgi:2-polyprenyl-3-methyl-5-hydroxy-6-metoxy-1,4-benzoquinol methylase
MSLSDADRHYLTNEIDPLYIAAARDFLYRYLRPGRVLNVGLGYGTWDERLAEERSSRVYGLDLSSELVSAFSKKYPNISYVCLDVFDYVPEGQFDTIVASHFLEHVDDAVHLLRTFGSWLAPKGRILIAVPNARSAHRRIGKQMGLLAELTDLNEGDHLLGHRRVYTRELLEAHVAEAGLSFEQLGGVTFKALSNSQLAQLPRAYVQACCQLEDLGEFASQLVAVVSVPPLRDGRLS